jgi:RimJ/RimL family protein N-acetyltransferase
MDSVAGPPITAREPADRHVRPDPPQTLVTARMRTERLEPAHLEALRRLHQDAAVMAWLGGVRDEERTQAYLATNLEHWTRHGFGLWMLLERERDEVIGLAVLRHLAIDGVDEIETGYALHREFWGRGLATEIATACIDYGRRHLGCPSIVALTHPGNVGSQRVLRKVGMQYEREIVQQDVPAAVFRLRW